MKFWKSTPRRLNRILELSIMRSWKIALAATAVAAVVIGFVILRRGEALIGGTAGAATPNPAAVAMPVPVATIVKKAIPIYLDYSARTESVGSISLQAKVSGYIKQQHVPDGADVKEGDLLYTIDPRDFQAALDQAKAQAQRDAAALDYARANLDRGSTLAKSGNLAKDSFDQRASTAGQAEATLAMDQAAVRTAEINLSYAEIRAPFAGRLGRNQAPVGALISVAGAPLNTLVQLDPIYVTFNPSETDLGQIQRARAAGKIAAEILLPGETQARHQGELTFIDNAVDRSTGTIAARATIGNADLSLLPGLYVRIRLAIGTEPDALMVPQTALGSSQLGKYVYVVGEGNKVDQRLVSLGPTDGSLVAVMTGVSEGEHVINGNLQKISPGALVKPLLQ
jgi:multidrug efflux system membrane fusion protein